MRHYDKAGYADVAKVNLVGHSMGGLVILTHLQQKRAQSKVAKVATLATPFRGSFESVIKVTTGTANLGTTPPSSREREAARITPSLYYLLPDLPDAVTTQGSIPNDLFDLAAWQPSVLSTIEEYIRLHGLERANRRPQARELFGGFLASAKSLRETLKTFRLADAGLKQDDWLCVVGVDADTRVRLKINRVGSAPEFEFNEDDRQNRWRGEHLPSDWHLTGDGTVPYRAALPHFLPVEKIVCVSPDDYSSWELQDRTTTRFAGFHGILPNMDMLHRLITRYFKGLPDRRGNTWGRPPVGVSTDDWRPPLVGGLKPA
jgi:pimeloyl-ACP methyl ester carboxylesterase